MTGMKPFRLFLNGICTERDDDRQKLGGRGGKQSSSYQTIPEGLEVSTSIQDLPPTKPNRNTSYLISFVTKRFRGKFMCFRVPEAQVLQVLMGGWDQSTDQSLPDSQNRQMISFSHHCQTCG